MAMGVTVDPSFAFPLPIFGINYLNFALGGRQDSQLAMLFAGVLAAVNVQRPKIGGTPFDASVDLFVIAVPSSDRVHDAQGEREGERVITWPETTGLNLGWQYTPFQKATSSISSGSMAITPTRRRSMSFRCRAARSPTDSGGASNIVAAATVSSRTGRGTASELEALGARRFVSSR